MILETITTLSSIRQQQRALESKKRDLTTPALSDLSLMPSLYDWFVEYITPMELRPSELTRRRKQFVLIVLYLYSPSTLNGDRISRGIRGALARLFRMKTPSGISNMISDVIWQYQQYADFRMETDELHAYLSVKVNDINPAE